MTYFIGAYHYTWWSGDDLPQLQPLPGLRCQRSEDAALLAQLIGVDQGEIESRFQKGSSAYIAFVQDDPAAYGWSASKTVGVAEAGIEWPLEPEERGLWDFKTLEPFRGCGIYPHLLQAILRSQQDEAERFWIGHRADNNASKRGIEKAGFQFSGIVVFNAQFQPSTVIRGSRHRGLKDPQGRFFGFLELDDSEMHAVDFDNLPDPPSTSP